ncbi:Uncharacterized protein dnm_066160 [Desulfonema magnum]|uniref:Uncharacterized protein n=1 Tax=Desulfonema magnum TaxID=45655 RepID=A0A975BRX2_9BACT|nr:Uncharacterized protein dnm_066160 [Desulfonema magnum]
MINTVCSAEYYHCEYLLHGQYAKSALCKGRIQFFTKGVRKRIFLCISDIEKGGILYFKSAIA